MHNVCVYFLPMRGLQPERVLIYYFSGYKQMKIIVPHFKDRDTLADLEFPTENNPLSAELTETFFRMLPEAIGKVGVIASLLVSSKKITSFHILFQKH